MYEIPYVNTIHVFNWYGRLVQKLETDYDIDKMFWIQLEIDYM